MCDRNKTAESR